MLSTKKIYFIFENIYGIQHKTTDMWTEIFDYTVSEKTIYF